MKQYGDMTPFALRFAEEYKGWMTANGITQSQISDKIGRNQGYVSERVNGRRALDTLDVDALAALTHMTGRDLMIELAKRARQLRSLPDVGGLEDDARTEWELRQAASRQRTGELGDDDDPGDSA